MILGPAAGTELPGQSPFKPKSESPFRPKSGNPFKPKSKSPFQPKSNNPERKSDSPFVPVPSADESTPATDGADPGASRPARPRGQVKLGKLIPATSPEGGWNYQPRQLTTLDVKPKSVDLEVDFTARFKQFDVNRPGTLGTITTYKNEEHTQVKVLNFQSGEVVASIETPEEVLVLAVEDEGHRLAIVSDKFGIGTKREIGVFLIRDSVLMEEATFVPFPDVPEAGINVMAAKFVGDHQLLAVSQSGRVSVWNLETLQEECRFDLKGEVRIASGADPHVVAFVDSEKFGLFDVSLQEFVGVGPLPDGLKHPQVAVSPGGSRMVLADKGAAVVIDAGNGQIELEIPLSGIGMQQIDFATDDFLLASSSELISIADRMVLWSYTGAEASVCVGGATFFMSRGFPTTCSVIAATLPDSAAGGALKTARTQPDLYAVRPGIAVRLDVSGVPAQHRAAVETAVSKHLQDRDLTVAEQSDVAVVAEITGPQQKIVEYGRSGVGIDNTPYEISEYVSTLEIHWKGQVAWQKKKTNAPSRISAREGQTFEDALREMTSQPNLRMFETAGIPAYVRKPSGKRAAGGEALGASRIDSLGR